MLIIWCYSQYCLIGDMKNVLCLHIRLPLPSSGMLEPPPVFHSYIQWHNSTMVSVPGGRSSDMLTPPPWKSSCGSDAKRQFLVNQTMKLTYVVVNQSIFGKAILCPLASLPQATAPSVSPCYATVHTPRFPSVRWAEVYLIKLVCSTQRWQFIVSMSMLAASDYCS